MRLQKFSERLNGYLKKAQLIISTQEGMLRIGGQGTNGEGEYYDPSKELLEMQRV